MSQQTKTCSKSTTKKALELLQLMLLFESLYHLASFIFLKSATKTVIFKACINGSERLCDRVCF